jgi:uncharacterized membrane protein
MITVAGLTFSLTIAALAQAPSHYTPRILRTFMRNRANQFVLGMFVGIFAYCLIVLRTIRGGDEGGFVPSLVVLFGLLLALVSIGVLVFFIHHITSSLQASSSVSNVAEETFATIERLFPQELGEAADEGEKQEATEADRREEWRELPSLKNGYIQSVDTEELLEFARKHDVVVRMERGIGQFAVKGDALISLEGGGKFDNGVIAELNDIYTIKHFRTLLPIVTSAVAGSVVLVLTKCITLEEAYAAIEWRVIFLLAGVLTLGAALEKTGAAALLSSLLISTIGA